MLRARAMRTAFSLCVVALVACTKPVTPAALSDFQMPIGTSKFPACKAENDGKRFALEGVVRVDGDVRVSDGKVTMTLSERADGGAMTHLELKDGTHVSFEVSGATTKSAGYRRNETTGRLEGVTLHTTSGDALSGEPVIAVVELGVQRLFQQTEIFGCQLEVIELRRR